MVKSGWYNESKRHALASKGIETGHKVDMPMGAEAKPAPKPDFESKKAELEQKLRDNLGNEYVDSIKADIKKIESGMPTTRGHYGEYMALLSKFPAQNRQALATMFVVLGADMQGVIDALKIVGGN